MVDAMVLKLTGGALIIGASTFAGFFFSKRDGIRETQLLEMRKALTILKNEIRFQLTPFGEAAAGVSEKVASPVSEIFALCAEAALKKKGSAAAEIWENAVKSVEEDSYYSEEDVRAFTAMGSNLGWLDKEMQSQSLDLLIEYIDNAVSVIREKGDKETKMYKSLGFLGGLLISVVLL